MLNKIAQIKCTENKSKISGRRMVSDISALTLIPFTLPADCSGLLLSSAMKTETGVNSKFLRVHDFVSHFEPRMPRM